MGLTDDGSGGEQEEAGPGTPGKSQRDAPTNLRDSARSAVLIATLLATMAALVLATIGIAAAAFSEQPKKAARAAPDGTKFSWKTSTEGDVWKVRLFDTATGSAITYATAIEYLKQGMLGGALTEKLRTSPHAKAFFWEVPPCTLQSATERPFEFVTLPAPLLLQHATDPEPFKGQLAAAATCSGGAAGAASFANLGGDAQLVVPCAAADVSPKAYNSIGPFLSLAPKDQVANFWVAVGATLETTLRQRGEQR